MEENLCFYTQHVLDFKTFCFLLFSVFPLFLPFFYLFSLSFSKLFPVPFDPSCGPLTNIPNAALPLIYWATLTTGVLRIFMGDNTVIVFLSFKKAFVILGKVNLFLVDKMKLKSFMDYNPIWGLVLSASLGPQGPNGSHLRLEKLNIISLGFPELY